MAELQMTELAVATAAKKPRNGSVSALRSSAPRLAISLMLVFGSTVVSQTETEQVVKPERPFPENRVRDFYANQARTYLAVDEPLPEIIPDFPGLDGGSFGHWGQNPEADNYDNTLNDVDVGGVLAQVVGHDGKKTAKAVMIRIGDGDSLTAMFDPTRLAFAKVWKGDLVKWQTPRYGITSGVTPAGDTLIDLDESKWQLTLDTPTRYLGYYRRGRRVAFSYQIGKARILDHIWEQDGAIVRSLSVDGKLPPKTVLLLVKSDNKKDSIELGEDRLNSRLPKDDRILAVRVQAESGGVRLVAENENLLLEFGDGVVEAPVHLVMRYDASENEKTIDAEEPEADYVSPKSLTQGGQPQWPQQAVTTRGELGIGKGPYLIDTITVPYRNLNPFRTPMRIGGFDFLPDGRAVVATLIGDIWLVSGIDADLQELVWKRIAAGLHQPLGLIVQDGKILVTGRDQITRLHDLDGNDEIDFYECVTNDFPTEGGNSFALTLHQDKDQNLYWFTRSKQFGVTKLKENDKPKSIATGVRGTNGMGVSSDGQIVLASAQEGSWTPTTAIFEVGEGSYHGFFGPREGVGHYGYQLPLCFVPRGIDNSSGDIAFVPSDNRWGPLAGKIIGTSFGYCQHYLILRETFGGNVQGGVVPLPGEFLSGAHRSRFNRKDGQFYVAGTDGWQSYAKTDGSLQRVRYVGGEMPLPTAIETHENGLIVRFNCRIDSDSVKTKNVFCQQWNYLYSSAYGSAEYSVKQPGRRGHDPVAVRSVHLLDDEKSVFVEIPHLHPVMQFHLNMQLTTTEGEPFSPDVYYSIFNLRPAFTDFDGDAKIERKKRYPKFPIAESYPQDARLAAQERLGKVLDKVVSVQVNAVAGLQYEPRRLRVPPGRRIALTLSNTDPSMPHNFVLVRPDRLERIGERSMILAADPAAVAIHYVPRDPGVICMTPILNPHNQYTIYFDSPQEKGAYPFLCTFPGHWKVMRGVLHVVDEGDPLPAESEPVLGRQFVRMWKTKDLAKDADLLNARSLESGREMFQQAGCIKCHVIAGQGTDLGPDLTKVNEQYKGQKLLEQILEPASEINKQYQTYNILTLDGKVITGLVVEEKDDAIHVLPNPLKPKEIAIVHKRDIEEMQASKLSTMPKGLLMTFNKEEILDLLFFIQSGGIETGTQSK